MSRIGKKIAFALAAFMLVSVFSIAFAGQDQAENASQENIVVSSSPPVQLDISPSTEIEPPPPAEISPEEPGINDATDAGSSSPAVPVADPDPVEPSEPMITPGAADVPPPTPDFTEAPEQTQEPYRSVTVKIHGAPGSFQYGDWVRLEAMLGGYDNVSYTLTWEYSPNGADDWHDAPGDKHSAHYAFRLDEVNALWYWRAVVDTHG